MNRFGLSLVLVLALATSACFGVRKPKKPALPPMPAPQASPTSKAKPIEPPRVTIPIKPVETLPEMPQVGQTELPSDTPPPKSDVKPVTRKPAKKTPPVQATATAPASAPITVSAVQPVPQLSVLLTAEQRNQYENDYARDMASAMDGLVHVLEHSLTAPEKESMTRIRSFMSQAEEVHNRDLATAAQLARRAAVLAQDLVQSRR